MAASVIYFRGFTTAVTRTRSRVRYTISLAINLLTVITYTQWKRLFFPDNAKGVPQEDCTELLPVVLRISKWLTKVRTTASVPLKADFKVIHGEDANATFYTVDCRIDCVSAGCRPYPYYRHGPCRLGAGCLVRAQRTLGA